MTREKHGEARTKLYKVWIGMKGRCVNEKNIKYKNYGNRGILICNEWMQFIAFRDWATANGYKESLSIDRIDNDGNYEPSNCRWATVAIQNRNTRLLRRNNTSGFRGVCFHKEVNKWVANIKIDGKQKYLGCFKCKRAAAYAYDKYIEANNLEHTRNFV